MLSRWARAACDQREIRKERLAKRRLVWVEAIMIEEITAHFPNFAELLVGITVEGLELARVDEGVIVVVHVVWHLGVRERRVDDAGGFAMTPVKDGQHQRC